MYKIISDGPITRVWQDDIELHGIKSVRTYSDHKGTHAEITLLLPRTDFSIAAKDMIVQKEYV